MSTRFVATAALVLCVLSSAALFACSGPDTGPTEQGQQDGGCCITSERQLPSCDPAWDPDCGAADGGGVYVGTSITNYTSRTVSSTIRVALGSWSANVISSCSLSPGTTCTGGVTVGAGSTVTYFVTVSDGTSTTYQYAVSSMSTACTFAYRDVCRVYEPGGACVPMGSEVVGYCD